MACGNLSYLKSPSGIFRLLTVVTGIPAVVLAWIAYFSSSWTDVFPEILAILAVEKSYSGNFIDNPDDDNPSTEATTIKDDNDSSSEEIDIISDSEEEYLDEILLQTLMYEKFFIGVVSVVFLMSAAYLFLRILSKHQPDSPYEIMFDFIFHVLCALGLLTGAGLVLLSAAKIQDFVDQVDDRETFTAPEIVEIIQENMDHVQDKVDKIAAAVIVMFNGIIYGLCVVTIRMTAPVKCKCVEKRRKSSYRRRKRALSLQYDPQNYNDMPVFSVTSGEDNGTQGPYGFFRAGNNNSTFIYD